MKVFVDVDDVITLLNELTEIDPEAVTRLIQTRVACNKKIADHLSVQVLVDDLGAYWVGFLGFVNGLFGVDKDGFGPIAALYELACPQGHDVSEVVEGPCPTCKLDLVTGPLGGFVRRPTEKKTKKKTKKK
jgi:hypothetical protein